MTTISYRASLKNPQVEEPIDLLVHRPLGYVVARAVFSTPISPDALTVVSMLLGLASAAAFASVFFTGRSLHVLAGALLIASAIIDCSDGQLARMRKSSSRYGRILDGSVDAIVQMSVVPCAVVWHVCRTHGLSQAEILFWIVLSVMACLTGMRHTTLYDHFKNVFVRNTEPSPKDCDDMADLDAEWQRLQAAGPVSLPMRVGFSLYRTHLTLTAQTMRWIDPNVPARFAAMPPFSPDRADRYRALNGGLMRVWSFFGIGTHIFTFSVCCMLDHLEWYLVLRAVIFNVVLLFLVPAQRRASRVFFGDADRDAEPAQSMAA